MYARHTGSMAYLRAEQRNQDKNVCRKKKCEIYVGFCVYRGWVLVAMVLRSRYLCTSIDAKYLGFLRVTSCQARELPKSRGVESDRVREWFGLSRVGTDRVQRFSNLTVRFGSI